MWHSAADEKPLKYKKSSGRKHDSTNNEDKPFQCLYCEHRTRFKADMEKHERIHTGVETIGREQGWVHAS